MAIPAVPNFDKDRIPKEGTASFRADASYVWSTIPSVIDGINDTIVYINSTASQISIDKATVVNKLIAASQSEANAKRSEEVATQKASEVLDYVIPEEATYNSAAIDTKNNKQNKANFSGYGIVLNNNINEIRPQDIFVEVDIPNVARLSEEAKQGQVRFPDGLHKMNSSDFALPPAPFALEGTDELLDDKANGLVCQTAHTKGDIVVTGNNIWDNSEAILDTGWTSNGDGTFTCDGTTGKIEISNTFNSNSEYVCSISILAYTSGHVSLPYDGSGANLLYKQSLGTYESDMISTYGWPVRVYSSAFVGTIKVNYVKLKDQSYMTLQDTTIGDSLTDINKFKPIAKVTKQVALLIEKTSTGAILNAVKKLVNMYGEKSVETFETDIFTELGCTQVADRVWTDGSSEFILLALRGYLNAGAYSPFNEFGSNFFQDTSYQFNSVGYWTNLPSGVIPQGSTYHSFKFASIRPSYSGVIGDLEGARSETSGKFYDKTYLEGQGGLICFSIPNAKTPTYKHTEEVKRNLNDGYIENRGDVITHGSMTVAEELSDTSKVLWDLTYPAIEVYQVLYTTDSGVTWNTQTFTYDSVNNQITLATARTDILVSYKALNQSAIPISTPKPIEYVDRDLIASNSHSRYAYNGLIYGATGKVATGNSVESRNVENITMYSDATHILASPIKIINISKGETVLALLDGDNDNYPAIAFTLYEAVVDRVERGLPNEAFEHVPYYKVLGRSMIYNTPIHNAITLDADSIVGVKALITQTANATQVFTQELIYDVGWGDTDEFDSLTESIQPGINGDVQHKILIKPSSVRI